MAKYKWKKNGNFRSCPPPLPWIRHWTTQNELNRWDDVYVSNAEGRVTPSRPDTSLHVPVTCQEANDAPSIVRSQGWYSNSKKDTSVTLTCDFWNTCWFWMIYSKGKLPPQAHIQETFSCSHTIWRKIKVLAFFVLCAGWERGVFFVSQVSCLTLHGIAQ